jgi:hypothetical protein
MVKKTTMRGQVIDFEALQAQQSATPSVGNTGTDAAGNERNPQGEITKPAEVRVREYYRDNPQASNDKVSLKGAMPEGAPATKDKTQKENVRTETKLKPDPTPPEGEKFDEAEPLGFKEVLLPNGDIEMVPYYTEEDNDEDKSV